MIEKVYQTIKKYRLLEKGDRVIIAHSGGPDSTALLAILAGIAPEWDLTLMVAHFNHGLRGRESDADEKYSHDLAQKLGLLFCSERMNKKSDKKGLSPEDFYRRQRYDFLEKLSRDYKAQKIALGHHLQDQAETVLLNLLRGSGLEGLKGFLPKRNEKIIRPLMEISRQEIIDFLKKTGISYCEDKTNQDSRYLRNKIRTELIPYLKENYNPGIEENLAQMAAILRNEDDFIKRHLAKVMHSPAIQKSDHHISVKVNVVKKLLPAIRLRLFKTLLEDLTPLHHGISFAHVMSLDGLVDKKASGKKVVLPSKIEARREYDHLILERKKHSLREVKYKYILPVPGTVHIRERKITIKAAMVKKRSVDLKSRNKIYLDMDKIHLPVIVRNRREGDRFQPLGMSGHQKIKKYFIDHKIPPSERNKIMLFVDRLSVIGIENMHIGDRVKVTPETKNVLKMEITGS